VIVRSKSPAHKSPHCVCDIQHALSLLSTPLCSSDSSHSPFSLTSASDVGLFHVGSDIPPVGKQMDTYDPDPQISTIAISPDFGIITTFTYTDDFVQQQHTSRS
jgi:hypothetical protein